MAVQISGNDITVPRDGSFTRNVTIGGTLTYEDVTNIDSVGLVTARSGIEVGARPGVAASISVDGNMIVSGISTFGGDVQVPDKIIHAGDTNTAIRFPDADTVTVETGGSERVRINSSGKITTPLGTSNRIGISDRTSGTGAGGSLLVTAGAARGSGQTTGNLLLASGRGNNSASNGEIKLGHNDGADGTGLDQEYARIESAGNVNIAQNLKVAGVCTATSFSGSGANLTGISAGILAMNLRLDGNKASYNPVVSGNGFTSGTELSNLTISMTPTNATTIFLITGNIYVTHSPSFMGKGYVTTQIAGGDEQMIAGNGDTSHRATFPISDGDAGTGWTGTGKTFTLFYDHNTTSAVTFRVRVATSNSGYPVYYNRDQDNVTNDNDGCAMLSQFMVQEIDSSIFTGTDATNVYRGT